MIIGSAVATLTRLATTAAVGAALAWWVLEHRLGIPVWEILTR